MKKKMVMKIKAGWRDCKCMLENCWIDDNKDELEKMTSTFFKRLLNRLILKRKRRIFILKISLSPVKDEADFCKYDCGYNRWGEIREDND